MNVHECMFTTVAMEVAGPRPSVMLLHRRKKNCSGSSIRNLKLMESEARAPVAPQPIRSQDLPSGQKVALPGLRSR
ncbi:hypothetical protein RRG08_026210 [Elysia crispata]|uniref:Uncharacterized protein n=1 Tax=Elysia crispata TaxID=231223 RepID=A0AAE0ZA98_9GAST|nr:hypothetical protein RRG08_026210 [Elysia crispata]